MGKTKIVVAHPDDEILFFSSIIHEAEEIIIAFGPGSNKEVTRGREELQAEFPIRHATFLNVMESDVYHTLDMANPQTCREGAVVSRNQKAYQENFEVLKDEIGACLQEGDTVFTHNPWGEYGHEEHIQVFHVVQELAKALNLKVFVSGYVSNHTQRLMEIEHTWLSEEIRTGVPNADIYQVTKAVYEKYRCWTWDEDYVLPMVELFYKVRETRFVPPSRQGKFTAPPLIQIPGDFRPKPLLDMARRILPADTKKQLKSLIKR